MNTQPTIIQGKARLKAVLPYLLAGTLLGFGFGIVVGAIWFGKSGESPKLANQPGRLIEKKPESTEHDPAPEYADKIQILHLRTEKGESTSYEKGAGIEMKVKNIGDRTITALTITVYFQDASGATIHEGDIILASTNGYTKSIGSIYNFDLSPIKPNYIRYRKNGFIGNVPQEWKIGAAYAKVKTVELE